MGQWIRGRLGLGRSSNVSGTGSTSGGGGVTTPQLASLNITPSSISSSIVGQQIQINAAPLDQFGNLFATPISYNVTDPNVANVTPGGIVTIIGNGTTTIIVTAGPFSKTCIVTVNIVTPVYHLAWVTKPSDLVFASLGITGTPIAKLYDSNNVLAATQPAITYTVIDPTIFSLSGSTLTSLKNGVSAIKASASGVPDLSDNATVSQVPVSLSVSPNTLAVNNSSTGTFTTNIRDANNQVVTNVTPTFNSANSNIISVDSSGNWTTVGKLGGNTTITVVVGSLSSIINVTVTAITGTAPVINATTGTGVMGANPTAIPIKWDAARVYNGSGYISPDAQWRALKFSQANLAANPEWIYSDSTKNGGITISANALYPVGSGQFIDLINLVTNSIIVGNIPAFRFSFLPSLGNQPSSGQVACNIPATRKLWIGRRIAHLKADQITGATRWDVTGSDCTNPKDLAYNNSGTINSCFTLTQAITPTGSAQTVSVSSTSGCQNAHDITIGTESGLIFSVVDSTHISANFTQAHSNGDAVNVHWTGVGFGFKHGPFGGDYTHDPSRAGVAGIIGNGFDGNGHMLGTYSIDNYINGSVGIVDAYPANIQNVDYSMDDGSTVDEVTFIQFVADISGNDYAISEYWHRTVNSDFTTTTWKRVNGYKVAPCYNGTTWINGASFKSVEFTSKNHNAAIGGPRYRDVSEWGCYDGGNPNNDGSDDPFGCLAADNARTPIAPTTVAFVSSTGTSGTFNVTRTASGQVPSYAVKLCAVIDGVDQPAANDYVIPFTYSDTDAVPVTIPLVSGTHSIQFKAVSGDGSHLSSAFPVTPISVSTSDVPGVPVVSNASGQTTNSLTFPVTLASSQAVPTALAWRYSLDNIAWTNGTDITLTSPTLGQALSETVPVPNASTTYFVQFAEKTVTQQSAWSASKTGTTTANGVNVPTGLSGVGFWQEDFTGYANTTALRAATDMAYHYPTLISLATSPQYNAHNVLQVQFDNLTADIPWIKAVFSGGALYQKVIARATITWPAAFSATGRGMTILALRPGGAAGVNTWDGTTIAQVALNVNTDGTYHLKIASTDDGGSNHGTSDIVLGNIGAEFTNGYTVDYFLELDTSTTSGGTWVATVWMKKGTTTMKLGTATLVIGVSSAVGSAILFDGNMPNTTGTQNAYVNQLECIDVVAHPDPFGLSAATATYTPLT